MHSEVNYSAEPSRDKIVKHLILLCFILAVSAIEYLFDQKDFYSAFPLFAMGFGLMLLIYKSNYNLKMVIAAGIITRLAILFVLPGFSDDVYRFFWDGRLILEGINPYGIIPKDALELRLPHLDTELFHLLNSPEYYTIYPPVNQFYFAISALTGDIKSYVVIMRLLIIATELAGIMYLLMLLKRRKLDTKSVILYYLNPLVIVECIGNLHFEVVMLSFMLISVYYIFDSKYVKGAFFLACSIGVKLLPLMIIPFFLFRMPSKYRFRFLSLLSIFLMLIFIPLFFGFASVSFLSSVDLYFRKFEFNASIYYILRYAGNLISGYNLIQFIGPLLAIVTLMTNIYLANKYKKYSETNFWNYSLLVWTIYLLLSTTVHPWYIISLVLFGILSDRTYPLVWSFLAFISYVNYSQLSYHENLWFVAIEYLLLWFVIIFEHKRSSLFSTVRGQITRKLSPKAK